MGRRARCGQMLWPAAVVVVECCMISCRQIVLLLLLQLHPYWKRQENKHTSFVLPPGKAAYVTLFHARTRVQYKVSLTLLFATMGKEARGWQGHEEPHCRWIIRKSNVFRLMVPTEIIQSKQQEHQEVEAASKSCRPGSLGFGLYHR